MVFPQATQPPQQATDDSVRITAQVRRQVLREHYTEKLERQQAVVDSERNDRKVNGDTTPFYTSADLRVSNTIAVLQDISATLAGLGDNRDCGASAVAK